MRWRTIPYNNGKYQVSDSGIVRVRETKRIIAVDESVGYKRVTLITTREDLQKVLIHRLVAEAFVANPDAKQRVNHIDGNPLNNSHSNLEWVSDVENAAHSFRNKKTSSKYVGVTYNNGKWVAQLKQRGRGPYIGRYDTEQAAHAARLQKELELGITNKYSTKTAT